MARIPTVTVSSVSTTTVSSAWDQAMSDYINKIYQDIITFGTSNFYYGSFTIEPNCPCQDHNKPEFESHSLFCDIVRKNEFWAVNRN
jgi:hypothetical protein